LMDGQGALDEVVVAFGQVVEFELRQTRVAVPAPVGDPAIGVAEQVHQVLGPAVRAGEGVVLADPGGLAQDVGVAQGVRGGGESVVAAVGVVDRDPGERGRIPNAVIEATERPNTSM
jgi:hypothetical protein